MASSGTLVAFIVSLGELLSTQTVHSVGVQTSLPQTCGDVDTLAWTSPEHAARGYHVLCVTSDVGSGVCTKKDEQEDCQVGAEGSHSIIACWHGLRTTCETFTGTYAETLLAVEEDLVTRVGLKNSKRYERIKGVKDKKKKWSGLFAFYKVSDGRETPQRLPFREIDKFSGLILAFEGGSFIWPGIEIGYERNVTIRPKGPQDTPVDLSFITMSLKPLVLEVSSFLGDDECSHVIGVASPHIARSHVSHMDHDVGKPDTDWRSSSTYFMPAGDDKILRQIDRRVAALTVTRPVQQEYGQVLRYDVGERYAAHTDYFDPDMYKKSEQVQSMTKKGLFNRLATVFFYLTTVEEGGHTNFPRAGDAPQPQNFENCDRGVSVAPKQGRIIIFYSQSPAGELDPLSLHGGCAVKKGVKWSVNKWIWNKPMEYVRGEYE
jgi:prolyl 4-hydroxylase